MNINNRLKVVGFFLTISEWDRHLEVIRQILNAIDAFEPYAAYLRLSKGRGTPITPSDILEFSKSNGFDSDYRSISLIVRLFDTRFEGSLDFEDFLKMILSRDNPEIRFSAAQRENYEVEQGDLLAPEIEYTLARFFFKASEFLSKIMSDPETHTILNQTRLFQEIDQNRSGKLDFHNLKAFFEESKIRPRDSEIIAILRIIDINDDGKIKENEFNFFIDLFNGREPNAMTLNGLKHEHEEENKVNYFGEKIHYDPEKYDREREGGHRYSPTRDPGSTFAKRSTPSQQNRSRSRLEEKTSYSRTSGSGKKSVGKYEPSERRTGGKSPSFAKRHSAYKAEPSKTGSSKKNSRENYQNRSQIENEGYVSSKSGMEVSQEITVETDDHERD